MAVKWNTCRGCNISVAMQLNKWVHICETEMIAHMQPFFFLVSSVKNNQHHCWLVRLLIGLLPDTRPFQWVVTRDRCSTRWPWEEKGHRAHRRSSSLQTRLVREWIIRQEGHFSWSATLLTRMLSEDVWVGRPRFVSLRLRGAACGLVHELIAGKSISRSTHWANWVPVFVWDDGEGVPPYQPSTSRRHAVVCGWLSTWFQILWWACVLFVLPQLKYETKLTQAIINSRKLPSTKVDRWVRGFCIVVVFLSPDKRRMSSISLSTQQYMISIVNTDCYKSPPVQTLALFAKLLTPAFEERTRYMAA